ncbi:hypothetical protein TU74_15390 [Pseudomonas lundensis]|nr:hypothetical protein TU74_15390 [Pseudomonas lundensis]
MGLAEQQAESENGAVVRDIRVLLPLSNDLSLVCILSAADIHKIFGGVRRNAKTKKPARRRVFRGFQRLC